MNLYKDMEAAAADAQETRPTVAASPEPLLTDEGQHDRIQLLAQNFSIEVLPKTATKVKSFAEHLPARTRVFIPFLPGARFEDCIPLAIRLRQEGMRPVPHIAARRLHSQDQLTATLERLSSEAQNDECLVIAGDPKTPVGPFKDSLALLEAGLLEKSGIRTIFVGGQPEGIPGVDPADVEAALRGKIEYARSSSAELRLVTQFSLDIEVLRRWQERAASVGNTLPVHIGIAGPTSLTTLLKFAALTGASASLRAMRRYGAKLSQLASEAAPDALISHLAQQPDVIAGLHTYTFGGFAQSAAWMGALGQGRFTLNPQGFTVP